MKRKTYPTDLSAKQWELLEPMLPPPERFGRKQCVNLHEIVNALCYLARAGCQWRLLPMEFPKWQTVYYYFSRWRETEWLIVLNDTLRQKLRRSVGKYGYRGKLIEWVAVQCLWILEIVKRND